VAAFGAQCSKGTGRLAALAAGSSALGFARPRGFRALCLLLFPSWVCFCAAGGGLVPCGRVACPSLLGTAAVWAHEWSLLFCVLLWWVGGCPAVCWRAPVGTAPPRLRGWALPVGALPLSFFPMWLYCCLLRASAGLLAGSGVPCPLRQLGFVGCGCLVRVVAGRRLARGPLRGGPLPVRLLGGAARCTLGGGTSSPLGWY